jgi:hypothetical protein
MKIQSKGSIKQVVSRLAVVAMIAVIGLGFSAKASAATPPDFKHVTHDLDVLLHSDEDGRVKNDSVLLKDKVAELTLAYNCYNHNWLKVKYEKTYVDTYGNWAFRWYIYYKCTSCGMLR